MTAVTLQCPNPECEAEYAATVTVATPAEEATRWSPAAAPTFDVDAPEACPACGEPLLTLATFGEAIDRAQESWRESAMDVYAGDD